MPALAPAVLVIAAAALPQGSESGRTGLQAEGTVLLEGVANLDGGVRSGTAGLYLLRGSLILDGRGIGHGGLRVNVTALATGGSAPGSRVGDVQGTSNIAAPDAVWPYEAWVQQRVGSRLSILAGLYDVNSEFDALDVAGLFLHSSFGIGADFGLSGPNGPSTFPATGLAVRLAAAPTPDLRLRVVAADGTPGDPSDPGSIDPAWRGDDGVLVAGELVRHLGGLDTDPQRAPQGGRRFLGRGSLRRQPGKVGLGVWRYAGVRPAPRDGPAWGAYMLAEGRLPGPHDDASGLGVFARAGLASGTLVRGYIGAGGTVDGLVGARPSDEAGLGLAVAWPNPAYLEALGESMAADVEAVVELSYRIALREGLFLQPDLQYVANPLFAPGAGHALVGIVRLGLLR